MFSKEKHQQPQKLSLNIININIISTAWREIWFGFFLFLAKCFDGILTINRKPSQQLFDGRCDRFVIYWLCNGNPSLLRRLSVYLHRMVCVFFFLILNMFFPYRIISIHHSTPIVLTFACFLLQLQHLCKNYILSFTRRIRQIVMIFDSFIKLLNKTHRETENVSSILWAYARPGQSKIADCSFVMHFDLHNWETELCFPESFFFSSVVFIYGAVFFQSWLPNNTIAPSTAGWCIADDGSHKMINHVFFIFFPLLFIITALIEWLHSTVREFNHFCFRKWSMPYHIPYIFCIFFISIHLLIVLLMNTAVRLANLVMARRVRAPTFHCPIYPWRKA